MTPHNSITGKDTDLVISRTFDAPCAKVWKAFTKVEHLAKWWGPKGFTMVKTTLDLKPGGAFHYGMRSPDGTEMWGKFVYREIEPQDRIVFVNMFSDAEGGITKNPWIPEWPLQVLNEATFTEENGKTTITLRGGPIDATEEQMKLFVSQRANMQQGFTGTWEQLDDYLRTTAL